MRLSNRGNWTLIGLLATVAIIAVLAYFFFGSGRLGTVSRDSELLDKGSKKETIVGQAIDTGKSVDCRQRLNQIRAGIQMYKTSSADGGNPPTLREAVSGVSTAYFSCPVSNQAYTYSPATGTVQCPTHPDF